MSAAIQTRWWHKTGEPHENKLVCTLCPRECHIPNNKRGFCFVRANVDGELVLTTYGRSSGFCIDPIEKKPLNHFLPGTPILSFGTAGCNLGCKFCQNWDISKSREMDRIADEASPEAIIDAAEAAGCRSVAFTYNDPVIWAEYAIDIAKVARQRGIKTVAVTAGYIHPDARKEFFEWMDAANVDLKAFTETFYRKLTQTHLEPVLETLKYLKHETDVWFEITNLMIPDENDSPEETAQMCKWIVDHVGDDVPVHFTAFHPDFKMRDKPNTPHQTLIRAREQALETGIKFAYVGNVYDLEHQSTRCPSCRTIVIERDWYELGAYRLDQNRCANCGELIPGVFEQTRGDWGRKRVPIRIHSSGDDFVKVTTGMSKSRQNKRNGKNKAAAEEGQTAATTREQEPSATSASDDLTTATKEPAPKPIEPKIDFSDSQVKAILAYCRAVVEAVVREERPKAILPSDIAESPSYGLFVSLKRTNDLRACRGRWGSQVGTLGSVLSVVARDAATMDPRFPSIYLDELPYLSIEMSLMYEPREVKAVGEDRINEVDIGRHGVVIHHPNGRGLLLPHVATESGFDAKTFLDRVCQKAGLPLDTWRRDNQAQLMTFQARLITSEAPTRTLDARSLHSTRLHALLSAANLALRDQPFESESDDLLTQKHGEELGLYLGTESGLTAVALGSNHSLLELAQIAAKSLKKICAKRRSDLEPVTRFTLLWQPIHLRAQDYPRRHRTLANTAVLARTRNSWALVVPGRSGRKDKVADALTSANLTPQQWRDNDAKLIAFNVLNFESRQQPSGQMVRQPARAGQFYPGDPSAMNRAIDDHLARANGAKPSAYRALMLPHAGWRFCGNTLAKTIARVKVPPIAIVISPKHTPDGPSWSIPPHHRWDIPGASMPIATDLARSVLDQLPDFKCEPDAHRMEHGVEVILPFLHRMNPNVRVLPIVMGQTTYEHTAVTAKALSSILEKAADGEPPLLVISSDMNHYANEEENRRRDMMAIDAMLTGEPKKLYDTCRANDISMCGVIPAVTIMQALLNDTSRKLQIEFIDYSNSAAITGDSSQVVGYAGVVLS